MYQVPIQIPETIQVETTDVITIGEIVGAVTVFVLGYLIAQLARRGVRKAVQRIPDTTEFAVKTSGQIAFWIGLTLGTVLALTVLGVNLGPLIATLVVVFLVLAFALRGYVENLAAGLVLQARRPFRPGHLVSLNEYHGTVREINNRTVVVDSWDGRRLFIPSKAVLDSVIINHTIRGQRRTTLDVGVAYDSDLGEAQRVLLEATTSYEGVYSNPPPDAVVTKFGDSSINFAFASSTSPPLPPTSSSVTRSPGR